MALTYFAIAVTYVPPLLQATRAHGHDISPIFMIYVFVIACTLPFLAGARNILGLIIIGIALFQAWKINRRVPLEITGPYKIAPTPGVT